MKFLRILGLVILTCLASCQTSSKKELHIYSWGDYINPEVVKEFEKLWDCQIVLDTYDSNESMYAKLKAGAAGYDIIFPSNYILGLLDQQQMLMTIDRSQIPNLQYLDEKYTAFIDHKMDHISVPYMLTFTGLGYRQDRIEEMVHSWSAFGEKRWRGRMTMLNDFRETIGAALKYLNFSVNSVEEGQINAAADQVIQWKANLAKFESEQYKNGLATAEFLVVQGYSGDVLQVMLEDEGVNFIYPQEGAVMSMDFLAIPKKANAPDLAHAFINFLYEPRVAAINMKWTQFICPNKAAYKLLGPDLQNSQVFFPDEAVLEKAELIQDIGPDVEKYHRAWDKIKG